VRLELLVEPAHQDGEGLAAAGELPGLARLYVIRDDVPQGDADTYADLTECACGGVGACRVECADWLCAGKPTPHNGEPPVNTVLNLCEGCLLDKCADPILACGGVAEVYAD